MMMMMLRFQKKVVGWVPYEFTSHTSYFPYGLLPQVIRSGRNQCFNLQKTKQFFSKIMESFGEFVVVVVVVVVMVVVRNHDDRTKVSSGIKKNPAVLISFFLFVLFRMWLVAGDVGKLLITTSLDVQLHATRWYMMILQREWGAPFTRWWNDDDDRNDSLTSKGGFKRLQQSV